LFLPTFQLVGRLRGMGPMATAEWITDYAQGVSVVSVGLSLPGRRLLYTTSHGGRPEAVGQDV